MTNGIAVTIDGEQKEFPQGTSYMEIAAAYQDSYEHDIVLVMADARLQELHKTVQKPCELKFITTGDDLGHKAYKRSTTHMMIKAVYDAAKHKQIDKVRVHYSVSSGYYCTIEGGIVLNQEFLNRVKEKMEELISAELPLEKRSINTDDAIALFHEHGMYDKEKLFHYRRVSKVNIYKIKGFEDYYYGYMVPNTRYLKYYELYLYDDGFVLQLPEVKEPKKVPEFQPQQKVFQVLKESVAWGDRLEVPTVAHLNEHITKGKIKDLILISEALQEKKMADIAGQILKERSKKLVMIAGPSSSGKTTFSHRLSVQLSAYGLKPHPIAVDNYFINREDTPLDEFGKHDFESLAAIDVDSFNRDMNLLLQGETVELPEYNFKTGRREYRGDYKQLGSDDILVIEGIHCLNDKLSHSLPKENKFKIYISALTQLNIDEHNRIPTTDGRLIRRMVRDARTRGTDAKRTIDMWGSVRRGEERNIFPYQEQADAMFNSALVYELAVLKLYAEPILFGIDKSEPEYQEAKRLLKFLDYFVGIPSEDIPKNSIIREFVGGSCFHA